tara:strand:+ start:900 stop:1085 length:186 start_codon:yes stop_codon:yes gene_type:complete
MNFSNKIKKMLRTFKILYIKEKEKNTESIYITAITKAIAKSVFQKKYPTHFIVDVQQLIIT